MQKMDELIMKLTQEQRGYVRLKVHICTNN